MIEHTCKSGLKKSTAITIRANSVIYSPMKDDAWRECEACMLEYLQRRLNQIHEHQAYTRIVLKKTEWKKLQNKWRKQTERARKKYVYKQLLAFASFYVKDVQTLCRSISKATSKNLDGLIDEYCQLLPDMTKDLYLSIVSDSKDRVDAVCKYLTLPQVNDQVIVWYGHIEQKAEKPDNIKELLKQDIKNISKSKNEKGRHTDKATSNLGYSKKADERQQSRAKGKKVVECYQVIASASWYKVHKVFAGNIDKNFRGTAKIKADEAYMKLIESGIDFKERYAHKNNDIYALILSESSLQDMNVSRSSSIKENNKSYMDDKRDTNHVIHEENTKANAFSFPFAFVSSIDEASKTEKKAFAFMN